MHRIFKKEQILTIPNLLTLVRLVLIPLIIWLYCVRHEYGTAAAVIILSGITDIADGFIARRFNMVSDFGKIVDPIADKLTQAAVIICLTVKYKLMYGIIAVFAVKEIIMSICGLIAIKKNDCVNSAKWYGKANTVLLYTVMTVLIFFPDVPSAAANVMIIACGCMMIVSLVMYMRFYFRLFRQEKQAQRSEDTRQENILQSE